MSCLDVVWVIISPGSSHSFRFFVVRYDIVVIGEFLEANGTDLILLDDLSPKFDTTSMYLRERKSTLAKP